MSNANGGFPGATDPISESLFNFGDGGLPTIMPSPDAMERAAEAVQYDKHVKISKIVVNNYDLNTSEGKTEYAKDMHTLFIGMQAKTHLLLHKDKQFVTLNNEAKWLVHLEWAEFELETKPVEPIKGA